MIDGGVLANHPLTGWLVMCVQAFLDKLVGSVLANRSLTGWLVDNQVSLGLAAPAGVQGARAGAGGEEQGRGGAHGA